jgi:hypothetical protein
MPLLISLSCPFWYHYHGDKANVLNYIHLSRPSDRCVGSVIHPTAILPTSYFTVDFGVVTDRQNWIVRLNSDSWRFAPTVGGGDGVGRCSATFQWVRRIHTASPVSRRTVRGNYTWSLRLSRVRYLWAQRIPHKASVLTSGHGLHCC